VVNSRENDTVKAIRDYQRGKGETTMDCTGCPSRGGWRGVTERSHLGPRCASWVRAGGPTFDHQQPA